MISVHTLMKKIENIPTPVFTTLYTLSITTHYTLNKNDLYKEIFELYTGYQQTVVTIFLHRDIISFTTYGSRRTLEIGTWSDGAFHFEGYFQHVVQEYFHPFSGRRYDYYQRSEWIRKRMA